jgi:hypothetical protein
MSEENIEIFNAMLYDAMPCHTPPMNYSLIASDSTFRPASAEDAQPIQLERLFCFSSLMASAWSCTNLSARGLLPAKVVAFSGRGGEFDGGVVTSSLVTLELSLVLPPGNVPVVGTWLPLGYRAPALGLPPAVKGTKKDCEFRGV